MPKIARIYAREILDSRGFPTIEAVCLLDNGAATVSSVPGGTSTGKHEAVELRDGDSSRYLGKGVTKAVANVNAALGPAVSGMNPQDQEGVDSKLIETDGTENKSKYGANAILAVSEAVARAGALSAGQQLYAWINILAQKTGLKPVMKVPTPLFNMINGGAHGAGNLDFQEFQVIPSSAKAFSESLRMGVEIYLTVGASLERRGAIHAVGLEGGYAPNLFTNADALEVFVEAIKETNYSIGRDVFLGIDAAANYFYKAGEYTIRDKSAPLSDLSLLDYYKNLNDLYKLAILEDPFHEDAWESWQKITAELSASVIIVGDDLLTTNPKRVQKAIESKACNGLLVKPNQIGTVIETLRVVKLAKDAGWKIIASHRSGETNDTFIADFAVGIGADYAKFGAPARGERVAKYNRLLTISEELSRAKK